MTLCQLLHYRQGEVRAYVVRRVDEMYQVGSNIICQLREERLQPRDQIFRSTDHVTGRLGAGEVVRTFVSASVRGRTGGKDKVSTDGRESQEAGGGRTAELKFNVAKLERAELDGGAVRIAAGSVGHGTNDGGSSRA